MMTSFARTGAGDFPLKLKVMVSGPPKSGKTTLLGTVPNIVIADTEPHANNLMSLAHLNVPYKTINSSTDLKDLHLILSNESLRKQAAQAMGMPDIEAVAIDTLDTLQGLLKRERLKENHSTQFLRDDWGWLKTEMENIVQSFLALPLHVFFMVHTKTKDVGTEKNPRSVVLPGLEGAIAESIAGMVGYSLLSFRKQEIDGTGTPYTKYWLRAEGDETYEFLGNRAAGRLPDVIEPDFKHLIDAAQAGLKQAEANQAQSQQYEVQTDPAAGIQTTGQNQNPAQAIAPPQNVAPSAGQPAEAPKPVDDAPITAAALQHIGSLFATIGAPFDAELFQSKVTTVGAAREIAKAYQAIQADHMEGKSTVASPQVEMIDYLRNQGLVGADQAPVAEKVVEPKVDGTIDQVMAYVGDDLVKVQEAYELEAAKGESARSGLIDKLTQKGAKVQTPVTTPEPAPEVPSEAVTPVEAPADVPTVDEAVAVVEQVMGPMEVLSQEINPEALCEVCGNKIDDTDLAMLGKNRFGKIMCVTDYLTETKK